MTKQEEINEGIDNILDDWFGSQLSREKIVALRKRLITFLYGKDVVIKVERELPIVISRHVIERIDGETATLNTETLACAGLVAVEPLVGDTK